MSQLQTDINLPAINSIDGFVTDGSMTTVMYSVENELDAIGNAVGNIYGTGDFQYDERKLINSIASSLGSELEDPALPYGIDLNDIVETHTLSGAKEAALGLILDTESSVTIEGFDNLNVSVGAYTLATDPYNMSDTECFVDGRLIFFKNPPYSFTIQYTGTYPTSPFLNKIGYMPNVIPNPKSEDFTRPALSLNAGRIVVSIAKANAVKTANTYADQYGIVLADYLLPFVDGSGVTPCPKAYISAYKLNTISGKYDKLSVDNIYIINAAQYELDTDEEIDVDNDTIIISIANMSIKEWLIAAVRELQNHKHDGSDISSPLNHSDLAGLIPRSLDENINYAKSQIPNNDHPQYLNREGYNEDDNGTYRNAMLGDLFMASVNPDNLFNNIIERSNQIVFGATGGSGHSVYRESQESGDTLIIASESNGIRVSYEYNNYKYAIAIQTNDGNHEMANRVDNNDLLINSKTGNTVFGKYDGGLASYVLQDIEADTANVDTVKIGPVSFARDVNNVEVTSTETDSSVDIATRIGIKGNTIGGGIRFTDGTNIYAKVYESANDGTAPTTIDNHLVVASAGDIYLTKNITDATTGIASDERATLYAGDTHFYTIGANKTSGIKKNGIQLGNDHSIYLTNTGEAYDSGVMVVEANNKVLFTKPSLNIDISNPIFTEIQAGNIVAHGEISGFVRSSDVVADTFTVNGNLISSVGSTSTFNGAVIFNDTITFNDDVSIGVLAVTNVANIEQLNAASAGIDSLIGNVSTNLKGQIIFSQHVSNPSSFICNVDAKFNEKMEISGETTITNTLTITSATTIQGSLAANGTSTFSTIDVNTATIQTANISTLAVSTLNIDTVNANNIATPKLHTSVDGVVVDGTIKQNGTGVNQFDADCEFGGDITISSTSKTLDVNNGFIKNLAMESVPANTDVPNVGWVVNTINNIALQALLSHAYPIGTIYSNAYNPGNPGSPAGPFGDNYFGTWQEYAEGRVIVGAGTGTDINNLSMNFINAQEAGEYKHALTIPELPVHNHRLNVQAMYVALSGGANYGEGVSPVNADPGTITNPDLNTSIAPSGYDAGYTGGGVAHPIMQPYVVARVWVRIA